MSVAAMLDVTLLISIHPACLPAVWHPYPGFLAAVAVSHSGEGTCCVCPDMRQSERDSICPLLGLAQR